MSGREKVSFAEAMKHDLNGIKIFGKIKPEDYEHIFSKNTLDADLGLIGKEPLFSYDLDESTRDRLLAHSRQDIALTYVALIQTRKELRTMRTLMFFMGLAITALLILK